MLRGMRDAELIAVDSEASPRVWEMVAIKVGNIRRDPDSFAFVHARLSKTDQEGRGAAFYLGWRTVTVLDAWMASAGFVDDPCGPMFRSVRKGGIVAGRLSCRSTRIIVVRRCGRGAEKVSGHSLRVGSALILARAGANLVELQQDGGNPRRFRRGTPAGNR